MNNLVIVLLNSFNLSTSDENVNKYATFLSSNINTDSPSEITRQTSLSKIQALTPYQQKFNNSYVEMRKTVQI